MDMSILTAEQRQELLLNLMIQMVVRDEDGPSRILAAIIELEDLFGPDKTGLRLIPGGKVSSQGSASL